MTTTGLQHAAAILARSAEALADGGPELAQAFRDAAKILAAANDQKVYRGLSTDEIVARIRGER